MTGRQFRSFSFRLRVCAAGGLIGYLCYCQGGLLSSSTVAPPSLIFPRPRREERLAACAAAPVDVLVVGAGIQGLCTAIEASRRGLSVALVEAQDVGSGRSSHSPSVQPGPLPYLMRALRQRDERWVGEAIRVLKRQSYWLRVAGDSEGTAATVTGCRTAILAPFFSDRSELWFSGLMAAILSGFYGGQLHTDLPCSLASSLGLSQRAVISRDILLDGPRLALRLAGTAEALGVRLVTYTSLTGLQLVDGEQEKKEVVATVTDTLAAHPVHYSIRAKVGVVNCAGLWADSVRGLLPETRSDPEGTVFSSKERLQAQHYVVTPRRALSSSTSQLPILTMAEGALGKKTEGLHVSPAHYGFRPTVALPYHNDCLLLGPSLDVQSEADWPPPAPGSSGRPVEMSKARADGFAGAVERVSALLANCGMQLDTTAVVSCLTCWVPTLRPPSELPWLQDYLVKGFHVSLSRSVSRADLPASPGAHDGVEKEPTVSMSPLMAAARPQHSKRAPSEPQHPSSGDQVESFPVAHVYGGISLAAQDAAMEALNTICQQAGLVQPSAALPALRPMRLLPLPSCFDEKASLSSSSEAGIVGMIHQGLAERVTDVLFRRLSIGYTSPAEAAAAVPAVAAIMARELKWSEGRLQRETLTAIQELESVAVRLHTDP